MEIFYRFQQSRQLHKGQGNDEEKRKVKGKNVKVNDKVTTYARLLMETVEKQFADFITIGGIYNVYKWGGKCQSLAMPTENISKDNKMGYEI